MKESNEQYPPLSENNKEPSVISEKEKSNAIREPDIHKYQQPYLSIRALNEGSCKSCVAVKRSSGRNTNTLLIMEHISS